MTRTRSVLSLVALAALVVCGPNAMAQRPGGGAGGRGGFGGGGFGGGGFGGMSPMMLAGLEPVQKELGLKEDQIAKLKTLGEEARKEMQGGGGPGGGGGQSLSDEERRKLFQERAEAMRKVGDKYKPKVAEVLDAKQNERLKQIQFQAMGSRIYQDEEVIKALDLSKEQQEKLAATNKEFEAKQAELFQAAFAGGGGGGGDAREKGRELREANDKKLAEVLSKDQAAKLETLKGAKFDVAQLRGGFGGPGGGGRPGAGGGGANPAGRPRRPNQNSDEKKTEEKKADSK
jgi:hypothetical protein